MKATGLLNGFLENIQADQKVLDVGSGLAFMAKEGAFYNRVKNYQTMDINPEFKPDIVGDVMAMPITDSQYDVVICKAVLEHVPEPQQAVNEIYRILKPGGRVYFYVPFLYPYHAKPNGYSDYFRYTKNGLEHLCRNFSSVTIQPVDGLARVIVVMIPFKLLRKVLQPVAGVFDRLKPSRSQTTGYEVVATK